MRGGSPGHLEGKTSLGTVREVSEEGGSGTDCLIKVLPPGGTGGATLWVGNLGVASSDAGKTRGVPP